MVLYQSGHGVLDELVDFDAEVGGSFAEDVAVACGRRADEVHRLGMVVVGGEVAFEKADEGVVDEVVAVWLVDVSGEEGAVLRQDA